VEGRSAGRIPSAHEALLTLASAGQQDATFDDSRALTGSKP
jgi:hypothetical protein